MTDLILSRAKRRELQKLAVRVERVTRSDAKFFERFPHRCHRVRLTSQAEIAQDAVLLGKPQQPPPGHQFYTAVKNIGPGVRLRLSICGPQDADTDLSEAQAFEIYERFNGPDVRKIEADMRAKFLGRPK